MRLSVGRLYGEKTLCGISRHVVLKTSLLYKEVRVQVSLTVIFNYNLALLSRCLYLPGFKVNELDTHSTFCFESELAAAGPYIIMMNDLTAIRNFTLNFGPQHQRHTVYCDLLLELSEKQ